MNHRSSPPGGNGTLEATGLPEFMPFGGEKKAEETLSGQADQVSKRRDPLHVDHEYFDTRESVFLSQALIALNLDSVRLRLLPKWIYVSFSDETSDDMFGWNFDWVDSESCEVLGHENLALNFWRKS